MNLAFLCPGQGAQTPGFLHRLPDRREVADTLDEAAAILGRDVRALDEEGALASTVAVQLSVVIAGVAASRVLAAEGVRPDAVAGLSVGTFTAAVIAGALSFDDALRLVRRRAELMEGAFPSGYGLAAMVGLPERQATALVARAHDPASPVYMANYNAPTQFVVAGSDAGLDAVLALARAAGARKAERLAVSVPSHCPLLAEAAARLGEAVDRVAIAPPSIPYVTNRAARVTQDPPRIAEDLAGGIMHPVHWHDGTTVLSELGVRLFVELPPGSTLASLATDAFPDARAVAMDDTPMATVKVLARRVQAE